MKLYLLYIKCNNNSIVLVPLLNIDCLFETRGGAPIRALKYNFIYNVKSENTNQLNINWLN